ncbi:hypothetical protein TWF225_006586 [Orbilia oligospora]|nr:hypothetical protein TWF225_006586 [Orbilia oligospora]KAF3265101.1 hypothetical protein TWF217_002751 [Orbilia oligospora]KAF3268027.1 hypothetical protein TWF128_008041 [Orbilia oligospora]
MEGNVPSRLLQLPMELQYPIFCQLIPDVPLTVTYYSPMHTRQWKNEMERLGASAELSDEWNRELPCATFLSIPPIKYLIPSPYLLVSRHFAVAIQQAAADYRFMLLVRLEKCLQPMICARFLSYISRAKCTEEFNHHLSYGRAIFGGVMPNTSNTMRRTLLPDGISSIFMTKGNFLGRHTEEAYWGPRPDQAYGSVDESLSWIGLSNLYEYCNSLRKVAVTMRGTKTRMDDYVYWFVLEAFRWLDNGSIDEVELVYEQGGPRDRPPKIWDELLRWVSQDWRDNQAAFWRFGWHGLDYIRKWSNIRWKFERVPNRALDRRGRFARYWDYGECSKDGVVEEVVVWSVKKERRQYKMGIASQYLLPGPLLRMLDSLAI